MKNTRRKILMASMVGAAIGTGLGILFAPYKGKKTRRKIKHAVEDTTDDVAGWLKNTKGDITKAVHRKEEESNKRVGGSLSY